MGILIGVMILLGAYLLAAIPWGLVIGKFRGVDIRKVGSGNIGATNVTRTLGRGWGRLCFALDFLKGFVPVYVVGRLTAGGTVEDRGHILLALTALACVSGHMWSVYIGFKGGKGVSTAGGILLALSPFALVAAGAVWVIVFKISRYVSLASICAAAVLPPAAWILSLGGVTPLPGSVLVLLVFLAGLTIFRHRGNIARLRAGTENRFDRKGGVK